ncbi:MAG TPA: hypothetical protein PLR96_09715, partial [Flavobacteriales bacterium]|nr:hypothetical protein [Flavobacteriales bacterium]
MTTAYAEAPATRPTLLTILCILSFLFGIWGVWGGVQSAFTDKAQRDLEETKAEMEKAMATMEGQGPGAEMMTKMGDAAIALGEKSVENAKPIGYSTI